MDALDETLTETEHRRMQRLRRISRLLELCLHTAVITTWYGIIAVGSIRTSLSSFLSDHPFLVGAGVIWLATLFLYILIFRKLPLQESFTLLFSNLEKVGLLKFLADFIRIFLRFVPALGHLVPGANLLLESGTEQPTTNKNAMDFYTELAKESRELAKSIMIRSQAYLFIGCLIAIIGLAFFYAETNHIWTKFGVDSAASVSTKGTDVSALAASTSRDNDSDNAYTLVKEFGPRIGILFFIEFVALFFLKQHRITMDEFRYYEQIGRRREETVALLKYASEISDFDKKTLATHEIFHSKSQVLDKEQSTELLESKKLDKGESELLLKIVDLVGQSKK